jgi:hypothetical protein
VCAIYADIIGAGGGSIYINSTPTRCLITWLSMQNYGYTTPRYDFQLALYPTGDFKIVWGPGVTNISTFGFPSDNGIVGATPGNNVALPAASDLSVGGNTLDPTVFELWTTPSTFDLASREMMFLATNPGYVFVNNGAPTNCAATSNYGTGCDGLTMTGVGRPSIGNSNYKLNITGVPLISPIALAAFGTVVINPGAPLSVIGMAGCSAYTNLDIGMFTAGPVVAQTSSFPLAIPPSPAIVGTVLSAQALSLSLFTAAGLASSNGTQITVGNGL